MHLKFAEFELEPATGELRRAGASVPIPAQAAKVLALLVEKGGATVTRDELRAHVWPDVHVSIEDSINTAIRQVRTALADSASQPRFIGTVRREGYRFLWKAPAPERRPKRPHLLYAIALLALLISLAAVYLAMRPREIVIDQTIEATVTVTR